jgi:hypothetical protein
MLILLQEHYVRLSVLATALLSACVALFAWPYLKRALRTKVFRAYFEELAIEYPELESFVLRLLASSPPKDLPGLMRHILIRAPSDRLRKLLLAYGVQVAESDLSLSTVEEPVPIFDMSEELLGVLRSRV